jgi:hypothetical protein
MSSEQSTRKKYKIRIRRNNRACFEKTLLALFKYGYVVNSEYRIRKLDDLYKIYGRDRPLEWEWIATGHDDECKMLLHFLSHWSWASELEEYETVNTVEELLFLNFDITEQEFFKYVEERDAAAAKKLSESVAEIKANYDTCGKNQFYNKFYYTHDAANYNDWRYRFTSS